MPAPDANNPIFLAISREACKGLEKPNSGLEYPKDSPHMVGKYLVLAVTPAKNWDAAPPLNDMFRAATKRGPNYTILDMPPITQGNDYMPALIMDGAQLAACEQSSDVRRVETVAALTARFSELVTQGDRAAREAERSSMRDANGLIKL